MKSVTSIRGQPFHLSGKQKDHNVAENLRNEGKLMFNTGKLFEALELYNKSLSAAQLDSPDIPLAYVERSAVYFEAKQYQLCLDNIQLAYDHGQLPEEKFERLRVLEEDCKEMMTTYVSDPDDDPWNFFKLSYAPHDKIPFIVNCLELQRSDNFGRFVITTQGQADYALDTHSRLEHFTQTDLLPGDVIAIEEPFFKTVHSDSAHTRCAQCVKSNKLSLVPSPISQTGKLSVPCHCSPASISDMFSKIS